MFPVALSSRPYHWCWVSWRSWYLSGDHFPAIDQHYYCVCFAVLWCFRLHCFRSTVFRNDSALGYHDGTTSTTTLPGARASYLIVITQ